MPRTPPLTERQRHRTKSKQEAWRDKLRAKDPMMAIEDGDDSKRKSFSAMEREPYTFNTTLDVPEPEDVIIQSGCNEVTTEI